MLIDETAAVGLNMGLGGGIFGGQGYKTFSPETANDVTQEVHAQAIRDIARDKNHPSVVLWSIANEPESETPEAEDYFRPLFDVAREADPTRPVGFVNVMLAPHGKCRVSKFGDVLMLNRYYGWYVNTGDLEAAELAWEEELTAWAGGKADHHHRVRRRHIPGLALVVSGNPWTEEYQVEYLDMNHRVFDRIDAVVGEQMWNFADFTTTSGIMRVGGNKKGAFTRDRQPRRPPMRSGDVGARTLIHQPTAIPQKRNRPCGPCRDFPTKYRPNLRSMLRRVFIGFEVPGVPQRLGCKYSRPRRRSTRQSQGYSSAHGLGVSSIGSPIGKIFINEDFEQHLERMRHAAVVAHRLTLPIPLLSSSRPDPIPTATAMKC